MEKRLKNIRISSGLEIDDISRATCITARYLKALEEGDFSEIPGDIYTRGYIKEYAKYLGVSFSEAIKEYESYLTKKRNEGNKSPRYSVGGKNFLRSFNIYSFLNSKNQGS